jgi:hypothetical protein
MPSTSLAAAARRAIQAAAIASTLALPSLAWAADQCPAAALQQAKAVKWQLADDAGRQALALRSLACLASPDPVERDELAFEALQAWMRAGQLDTATVQALRARLAAQLEAPDPLGFARPFAALVLAEVARVDRIKPYMTAAQRAQLVDAAASYLRGVRDYRGFDAQQGWRHGVAHAADVMLQLALNPALSRAQHEQMLSAIASQVAPAGEHFYLYGEGERLMAPVFYLSRAKTMECSDWDAWFERLAAPPAAQGTRQAALARIHNLKAFLQPLLINIGESRDEAQRACLKPLVLRALKQAGG